MLKKYKRRFRREKKGSGYNAKRKLGFRPKESWKKPEVSILSHTEQNLTNQEAANKLAHHFSSISQTVEPLDQDRFHPALKQTLKEAATGPHPILSQHEVYRNILRVQKPKSAVANDVPRPMIRKYPFIYAAPVTKVFNKMIQTGEWPRQWVKEEAIVLSKLEKTKQPANEDDLRTISKTAWLSKLCENMLGGFILPAIDRFIDPGQCGGLKKSSITHYLV